MGAALTLIVDLFEGLAEVSTLTGFSAELILTGEALASVDAEITALSLEGVFGTETALATMGISEEVYQFLTVVPATVNQIAGSVALLQTVNGASAISLGIQRYFAKQEVSTVNRNMALVPWRDPDLYDIFFPGIPTVAHGLNVIGQWGHSLAHAVGRYVWQLVTQHAYDRLEGAVRGVALRQTNNMLDGLSRLLETTRWVVTNAPETAVNSVSNAYSSLRDYYRDLGLNPPQRRALFKRALIEGPEGTRRAMPSSVVQDQSGEVIEFYHAPGGAHQRVTPDWMLPLILGLYGDITPTWATYLDEDGPKKKKRRF